MGRFINADGIIGANGGLPGYNLFAYCNNNPIMFTDPNGTWTVSFSIGANLMLLVGVHIGVGVAFDDDGNIEVQWSYSVPGVNDTISVGFADLSIMGTAQYTNADTVEDLYGLSTALGVSAGTNFSIGGDIVYSGEPLEDNPDVVGFQLTGGFSAIPLNARVTSSQTKELMRIKSADAIDEIVSSGDSTYYPFLLLPTKDMSFNTF